MDLREEIKRETLFRKSSIFMPIAAVVVLVSFSYIQHRVVPAGLEIAIRTCVNFLGFFVSPLLLFLGCLTWVETTREKLSVWRNGIGLSSMVLVSSVWMIHYGASILSTVHPVLSYFFNPDWMAIYLCSTILASLLAIALKGAARLFMISAALLMCSGLQSGIYF
jgi:hypothetical protein